MKVDFESAVSHAWQFAKSIERLFVLSLFYLVAALLILLPVIFIYRNITLGAFQLVNLVQFFVGLFAAVIIAILLVLYSNLMFMHNYANQKSVAKSAVYAKKRYLRFLGAMIIVGAIDLIASIPPIVGFVLSIIVGLIFFFVQQEIAVAGSRISKSLSNSYNIFKRNWLQVVITFILSALLGFLIILIFAIPLLVVAFATILPSIGTGQIVPALLANLPLFAVTGLILLVGVAFASLFTIGIKTDIYLQLKKRRK